MSQELSTKRQQDLASKTTLHMAFRKVVAEPRVLCLNEPLYERNIGLVTDVQNNLSSPTLPLANGGWLAPFKQGESVPGMNLTSLHGLTFDTERDEDLTLKFAKKEPKLLLD